MTPDEADAIVNRARGGMLEDGRCDLDTITMLCKHLRATLEPLVKVKTTKEQT